MSSVAPSDTLKGAVVVEDNPDAVAVIVYPLSGTLSVSPEKTATPS